MKTRIGKIARLPAQIREELNHRLANGVLGKELLAWLHTLLEVQKVLAAQFGGRPITKQNLSDWRHGGFFEWAEARHGRAQWREMLERAQELNHRAEGADLRNRLVTFLIVELAEALDQLHAMKNTEQRWKLMRTISMTLARLQTAHAREKRLSLQELQAATRNCPVQPSPAQSTHKKITPPFMTGGTTLPPARPLNSM